MVDRHFLGDVALAVLIVVPSAALAGTDGAPETRPTVIGAPQAHFASAALSRMRELGPTR